MTRPAPTVTVPRDDDQRPFSDSLLPEAMIYAGSDALDRAQMDMANYVSGETIDWDHGMIAVAVYRAMLSAAPAAPQAAGVGEAVAAEEIMATLAEEVPALDGYDEGELASLEASVASIIRSHLRAPSREPEGGAEALAARTEAAQISALLASDDPVAQEQGVAQVDALLATSRAGRNPALATREEAPAVPDDVRRLVEAARVVAFEDQGPAAIKALDVASEAFADRVPWEGEPYEEAPALENPDEPSAPENARDWEAPAEAGEREIVAKALAKIKGHRDVNAVIWLNEPQIEKRAWEFYLDDADVVLSALRSQPPAREDAQPVAWRYRSGRAEEHWTFSATEVYADPSWGIEQQPLYTHPAPDALRVAVEEAAKAVVLAAWTDRFERLHGHPSVIALEQALAALQAEQKGGA